MELIKPLYFKNKELQGSSSDHISDFEISVAASKIISDTEIICIQKDRDLWRLYLNSSESRTKLLSEGFDIRSRHVGLYDTNPFSAGIQDPSEKVLKITIKGVPLSVDDSEILKMLKQFDVNFTSDLKYEKIRNPTTKKMTSILNGNRFIYASALPEGKFLPRTCRCAGLLCFIYHFGQPSNKRQLQCNNCWETTHRSQDCPNNPRCKVCNKEGHSPGDEACEHYTEPSFKVVPFAGASDVLSNFYPCEVKVFGTVHKSAEHAYQYVKAVRGGDIPKAQEIQSAHSAFAAKQIGKRISSSPSFESKKIELMTEIIEAKYDQVSEFRETLRKAKKSTIFVESTYDNFWASGIDKKGTAHTDASAWPGKNVLGDIIGKVAVSHCKENRNPPRSNSAPRPSKSATQLDISTMLSELKTPRKRDSSGSRKASPKTRTNDGKD